MRLKSMENPPKRKPPEILSGYVPAYIQVPNMTNGFDLFRIYL